MWLVNVREVCYVHLTLCYVFLFKPDNKNPEAKLQRPYPLLQTMG